VALPPPELPEFIFGPLSTEEGRVRQARRDRLGLDHPVRHLALAPEAGERMVIRARVGTDLAVVAMELRYATDPSLPLTDPVDGAMATELASLRERIGRTSRHSSKPPSSKGPGFAGVVVSDRYVAYNHLPTSHRQLCWAHLLRDLTAIAERQGASTEIGAELLALQRELFAPWHRCKDGTIDCTILRRCCQPMRLAFEQTLQRVVELGSKRGETPPWAGTVSTCGQLLKQKKALWTFLDLGDCSITNDSPELKARNPPQPE
jgi:hypothetical protein